MRNPTSLPATWCSWRPEAAAWLPALAVAVASCSLASAQDDPGRVTRTRSAVASFRADNPCPANGKVRGACPGWEVDHIVPLCAGGEDQPSNLQWLSRDDHRFKTAVDGRECRKLRALAARPATSAASDTGTR